MRFIKKICFFLYFCFIFLIPFGNCDTVMMFGQQQKDKKIVEFTEVRRLNSTIKLKPSIIIKTTKEIKDLYKKFNNSRYSRSAPIPVLENDDEIFLVLKPILKNIKYGDFEVEKIESDGLILYVFYKEVDNQEYFEKKQSNPIIILKIFDKPKKIKLIKIQ